MNGIGIDWVSTAVFAGAFLFSQIRAVPLRLRYGVLAAACAGIAIYRLRGGLGAGPNMIFPLLAGALAVYYAFKAIRAGDQPR